MIEPIHDNIGYLDFVTFLNNEISSPTVGYHSELVNEVVNWIQSKDYWCYIQEMYTHDNVYKGVYVVPVISKRIVYIENGVAIAFNYEEADVDKMFVLFDNMGMYCCYSDVVNLYNDVQPEAFPPYTIYGELQIYKEEKFGSEIYFSYIRFNNVIQESGVMQAQLVAGQQLTNYNLKIDKTPFATISFKSAKNTHMSFHVETATGVFQAFTYESLGQVMYVQDTQWSRKSLRELSKLGIVFLDF